MADKQLFVLAGLWDFSGDDLQMFTILTTSPNEMMEKTHNRKPVVIDRDDYDRWLDTAATNAREVADLLWPYPAELMMATQVSSFVNSTPNEGPKCIALSAARSAGSCRGA